MAKLCPLGVFQPFSGLGSLGRALVPFLGRRYFYNSVSYNVFTLYGNAYAAKSKDCLDAYKAKEDIYMLFL